MQCPSCSTENGADAKTCESCGTFLGPTLAMEKPSEDEVPNHLVLAVVAAGLPLLCAVSGGLALLAIPVALFAVLQARSVEDHVRRKDVPAARAASINAQRFAIVAMALAFVLSIGSVVYKATALADVVQQDLPTGEDVDEVPASAEEPAVPEVP